MGWRPRALIWQGIGVLLVLAALFLGIPGLFADRLTAEAKGLRFLLQTLAGNWPATDDAGLGPFWFMASAVLAVVLNNGLIWVVVLFVWNWGRRWRARAVKMMHAVAVRDQAMKQALIERFGDDAETIARINAAFGDAQARWPDELRAMFGDEAAAVALDLMQKQQARARSAAE